MTRASRPGIAGLTLCGALLLGVACSDDGGGPTPDKPVYFEASVDGPQIDGQGTTDGKTLTDGKTMTDGITGDQTCLPDMGTAQACGGSPVGTWKYKKACVSADMFSAVKALCTAATFSNTAYTLGSGTNSLVINSNHTFTRNVVGTVSSSLAVPASCAPLGCGSMANVIKNALPSGGNATCTTGVSGVCPCSLTVQVTTNDSGSWSVSGGTLTAVVSSVNHPYYFCVSGNVLKYHGTSANTLTDKNIGYVLTP